MAAEIEARLRISAQDRTAKAFSAIEGRLKKAERLTAQANRQQRQMAVFERSAARVDRALWMGGAAIVGGLAAAGGVRGGLDTLTSYEDALIEIAKKGGLTTDQMHAVGKEAKALATSGDLAVPLEEILSSYERAAAAGLPIGEWREFAALSAKAADAFGMTAEEVGNAAAGFKVGLGIPMSEMERYFDLINSLADSGISDESDIIKFLDNAGAGLKNFGLNAREAAAYGAALLNLKLGPETGARMMNMLTSRLIAPENLGKKGYSALREVVGDVKAFKKEMAKDPSGALRAFLGQLAKLDKFRRARLTGAIFGQEWSDEIMRLVDGLEEVDRNMKLAASQDWFGSLSNSYQMKLGALSSRWQIFKNQVAELAIDLGELSMPALEAGLEKARSLVKEIGEEIGKFGSEVDQDALAGAKQSIDTIVGKIEELLNLNGDKSQLSQFFRDLANVTGDVATAVTAIQKGVAYITNPFGSADDGSAPKSGAPAPAKKSYLGGAITIAEGSIADSVVEGFEGLHDWMDWWSAEIRAAAQGLPPPPDPGGAPATPGNAADRPSDEGWWAPAPPPVPGGTPPAPPGGTAPPPSDESRWTPAPPPSRSPLSLQINGSGPTADALRTAMEEGGGRLEQAGADIEGGAARGADALNRAAAELERAIQNGAAALSAVRIPLPTPSPLRPTPNANLGPSMPNAGAPGGG